MRDHQTKEDSMMVSNDIGANCLASAGRLFNVLIEEGKKEFEYIAVRENIVCKLSEVLKLYLEAFPTV